jgi:uracil-DNA glycosylase
VAAPLGTEQVTTLLGMPGDILRSMPEPWRDAMRPYLDRDTLVSLERFLAAEYAAQAVFPPRADLFAAFRLCPPEAVRVVLLGQDPYHRVGQAHGLSFSVPAGVPVPPSLRNVFKELQDDLGESARAPAAGDLSRWAEQGVLLLNAVLSVRAGQPGSHAGRGWEHLTDAAIRVVDAQPARVVFLLWGAYARRKAALVRGDQHVVLTAGHPSPLNPRGFLGSRPFSACNAALVEAGRPPVAW